LGIDLDAAMHKLTQELWEFNDSIQKYRWIYCKTKYETLDEVEWELSDILFNIVSICNKLGIDVDKFPEFVWNTVKKAESRIENYKKIMRK
jgi:NTP pyrophosphatase (non-canonical NTP hydrolase)